MMQISILRVVIYYLEKGVDKQFVKLTGKKGHLQDQSDLMPSQAFLKKKSETRISLFN